MNLKKIILPLLAIFCLAGNLSAETNAVDKEIKKVLVIGDSMTGWLGERLAAYGQKDGFQVAIVIWDGSTVKKWANSPNLKKTVTSADPDLIMVCLGMNEFFDTAPAKNLSAPVSKLLAAFGDIPYLWIGPPTWPGKGAGKGGPVNSWFAQRFGKGHYFDSMGLTLPRQSSTNPHPTREGCNKWMDAIVDWIPANTDLRFPSLAKPAAGASVKPRAYTYRRMKQSL